MFDSAPQSLSDGHLPGRQNQSVGPRTWLEGLARSLRAFITRARAPAYLRRGVTRALTLRPRGFVANDALRLERLSACLEVEWRTRVVHPWDEQLPPERRARVLCEQTLHDTEEAILGLFRLLPEVERISIRVRGCESPHETFLAGTVAREDVRATNALRSPGMRLRMMGVRWNTAGGALQPLR